MITSLWPGFLEKYSNCDHPLPAGKMGNTYEPMWPNYDLGANDLLLFMIENQGVCAWAVPLHQGDDPPVLVEVDSGNPPIWQVAAPTLSLWLRCQVEDHAVLGRAMFAAQAAPLSELARAQLVERFRFGAVTSAWPAREVLRMRSSKGDVLLWNGDDQCDWWIAPVDTTAAGEMLDSIPFLPNDPGSMYEVRPEGRPILEAWASRSRDRAH